VLKNFFKSKCISDLPQGVEKNRSLKDRLTFFERAELYQRTNFISGVYCEFGVHTAQTFRMALNTLGQHRKRSTSCDHFYAFDTFGGMPEPSGIDRSRRWKKGVNATTENEFRRLVEPDLFRVSLVPGLFSESLPSFHFPSGSSVSLAYIDCDYYQSTAEVVEFITPYLRHGSIVAFDDWDCYYYDPRRGQQRACMEWRENNQGNFELVEFVKIGASGMSFVFLEKDKIGLEIL